MNTKYVKQLKLKQNMKKCKEKYLTAIVDDNAHFINYQFLKKNSFELNSTITNLIIKSK